MDKPEILLAELYSLESLMSIGSRPDSAKNNFLAQMMQPWMQISKYLEYIDIENISHVKLTEICLSIHSMI